MRDTIPIFLASVVNSWEGRPFVLYGSYTSALTIFNRFATAGYVEHKNHGLASVSRTMWENHREVDLGIKRLATVNNELTLNQHVQMWIQSGRERQERMSLHFTLSYRIHEGKDYPHLITTKELHSGDILSVQRPAMRGKLSLTVKEFRPIFPYKRPPSTQNAELVKIAPLISMDELLSIRSRPTIESAWYIPDFATEMAVMQDFMIHAYREGFISESALERPFNRLVKMINLALQSPVPGERDAAVHRTRQVFKSLQERIRNGKDVTENRNKTAQATRTQPAFF